MKSEDLDNLAKYLKAQELKKVRDNRYNNSAKGRLRTQRFQAKRLKRTNEDAGDRKYSHPGEKAYLKANK